MNNWILLIISMSVGLIGGIARKLFTSKYENAVSRHLYNFVASVVATICLFIVAGQFKASVFTLLLGAVFGLTTAIQQIFFLKAMEVGPWSYTTVITSLSTIIPALSGVLIWNESISFVQIIGIVLMLFCMVLSTGLEKESAKKSLKWIIYSAVSFVTTGLIGVMQKWHQSSTYSSELGGFLIIAFAVSFIYSGLCSIKIVLDSKEKKELMSPFLKLKPIIIMLITGISLAVINLLNLYLSGVMDSAVFFPLVNGGGLVLTTVSVVILFKEKLDKKQWLGLVIGIVSVVLLCNPF